MNTHHNKMSELTVAEKREMIEKIYRDVYEHGVDEIVDDLYVHYKTQTGMNMSQEMMEQVTNKIWEQLKSSISICPLVTVDTRSSSIAKSIKNIYFEICLPNRLVLTFDNMTREEIQLEKERLERELRKKVLLVTYTQYHQQETSVLNIVSNNLDIYHKKILDLNPTYYEIV